MKSVPDEGKYMGFGRATFGLLSLIVVFGLLAGGCATEPGQSAHFHPPAMAPSPAADVLIISATYGSGTHHADVTYRVNDLLRQPNVVFPARPNWLGADPTPGWNKELVVIYEYKGQRHMFLAGEGSKVSIEALIKSAKKSRHD